MPPYAPAYAWPWAWAERVRCGRATTTIQAMLSSRAFALFWCMEVAGDLTGLEGGKAGGLYAGLGAGFLAA